MKNAMRLDVMKTLNLDVETEVVAGVILEAVVKNS
jgi:hypothetical protein